jgi:hypothetical protein
MVHNIPNPALTNAEKEMTIFNFCNHDTNTALWNKYGKLSWNNEEGTMHCLRLLTGDHQYADTFDTKIHFEVSDDEWRNQTPAELELRKNNWNTNCLRIKEKVCQKTQLLQSLTPQAGFEDACNKWKCELSKPPGLWWDTNPGVWLKRNHEYTPPE